MKIAFTIGAYRLLDFVRLGVKQLQKLAPKSPILISDDYSAESACMKRIADDHGCVYTGSKIKRGHFCADYQSIVNSVAFAEANNADLAVKISQRMVLRKPEAIDVIRHTFEGSAILVATPARPRVMVHGPSRGFSNFAILTDIVMIRVGCISPQELIDMYRSRLMREKAHWASFIEPSIDDLHVNKFPGRTAKIEALTNPTADPIYLRRYQASEQQYEELAIENGFTGRFILCEWAGIEGRSYSPKPMIA